MGLLQALFRSRSDRLEEINSTAIGMYTIPMGPCSARVYVYDGTNLMGLSGHVTLVVAHANISMKSIYTGTRYRGSYAVYAGGIPIGFMAYGYLTECVKKLTKTHGNVAVHARVCGLSRGGWPVVVLDLPYKSWFVAELRRERTPSPKLTLQRTALIWQLKAVCNEKGRREFVANHSVNKQ